MLMLRNTKERLGDRSFLLFVWIGRVQNGELKMENGK